MAFGNTLRWDNALELCEDFVGATAWIRRMFGTDRKDAVSTKQCFLTQRTIVADKVSVSRILPELS